MKLGWSKVAGNAFVKSTNGYASARITFKSKGLTEFYMDRRVLDTEEEITERLLNSFNDYAKNGW